MAASVKTSQCGDYRALKTILGIEGAFFGAGGYARVLCALGIDLRLATKVALRILSARARLLIGPNDSAIPGILEGVRRVPGATWLDDSLALEHRFGISEDFLEFAQQVTQPIPINPKSRLWIRTAVLPNLLQFDRDWLATQEQNFLPWLHDVDVVKKVLMLLASALWSKREWLYTRAWYLSRLSGWAKV